jgi:hypothetical protein
MPSWGDRIARLFGSKPAPPSKSRKSSRQPKSRSPKSKGHVDGAGERAELIKGAMAVYRSRRGEAFGTLEQMRKKPPKIMSEQDDLVRLLALHQANLGINALMSHDLRRYLVLSGIRGLMEDFLTRSDHSASPVPPSAQNSMRRTPSKR